MNNKTLWISVTILIVVFGIYSLYKDRNNQPENTSENQNTASEDIKTDVDNTTVDSNNSALSEDVVVEYTNTGFVPETITVKEGQTVLFINKSNNSMWVASDSHPSHQILPEFDQLTKVGINEIYSYTFLQDGSWKYHNHVKPRDGGVIIVNQ